VDAGLRSQLGLGRPARKAKEVIDHKSDADAEAPAPAG
jgi:hypothetical protein